MQNPCPDITDVFNAIRDGCRFVAGRASHVRIRDDRLAAYAMSLQSRQPDNTLDDDHHFMSSDFESLAAFVLTLDSINFGSGYKDDLVAEGWDLMDHSIYFTVSTRLKNRFEHSGPFTASDLATISPADITDFLDLPPSGRRAREIAALYAQSANELGRHIVSRHQGRFLGLIDSAGGRAAGMVEALAALPAFRDIPSYQGRSIPIYKRAQHATASLQGMFEKAGRTLFSDMDRLTMFADNAVAHVLRMDEVVEYTPALAARIESGDALAAGSAEETEIRCCALDAVERLAAIKGIKPIDLDYTLWHRSVEQPRYRDHPTHKTYTIFY